MKNCLIIGCGDTGIELARVLLEQGVQVLGMRRNAAALPKTITPICADLTSPESLKAIPADIDTVVYMAAPSERSEAAYHATYYQGLKNVLTFLQRRQNALKRFIFVSSTSVYGQDDGSWVDETSATEPNSFTGRILLQAEALLEASDFPYTIIRAAGIYGPGRTMLLRRLQSGQCHIQQPVKYMNRIHRDDLAGFIAHVLRLDAPAALYIAVDDKPSTQQEVYAFLAEHLGCAIPPVTASTDTPPSQNKRLSNKRLHDSGYKLWYATFKEGYTAIGAAQL